MLASLHADIERRLQTVRDTIGHPGVLGDGSEAIWLELLERYLPERYSVARAHVIDSLDNISQQIDVVVFDRQYTPFIFVVEGQKVIPAESVYAVFEAKQVANAAHVKYAQEKTASVRRLHRTSLPIPHAGGTFAAKPPIRILGGLLTLDSDWSPAFGDAAEKALKADVGDGVLDLGCIASHGHFVRGGDAFTFFPEAKPATAFLFKLISMLQFSGTVPMIDVDAYARWLQHSD
ncbi:DUF6602 domain-containing protein [Sphingomonas sp. UNC305MFCol5.2]|uniref:DUF6602 domain-containing protein n=1 Tax=Sphingomonas sp. UNC305MFCol5.2 TaxID=1449076 RepID=UPI0022AF0E53|nr:DUF6602 domain-containing protein [Sphingomonas sp. UNC305MFCol5.2]